jgi:hypothetical protein
MSFETMRQADGRGIPPRRKTTYFAFAARIADVAERNIGVIPIAYGKIPEPENNEFCASETTELDMAEGGDNKESALRWPILNVHPV